MLHFPIKIRIQRKNFANSDPDLFQTHTTCLQNFVEILHKLYKKNFSQQQNLPKHLKHIKQKTILRFYDFLHFFINIFCTNNWKYPSLHENNYDCDRPGSGTPKNINIIQMRTMIYKHN